MFSSSPLSSLCVSPCGRYDKMGVAPAFPFGFGLSYGSFKYSGLAVAGRTISMVVERDPADPRTAGCDTAQFYFSFPAADTDSAVPTKVLRYFEKVCVDNATVSFTYTDRDVSNWDVESKQWVVTTGKFVVWGLQASQGGLTSQSTTFTVA